MAIRHCSAGNHNSVEWILLETSTVQCSSAHLYIDMKIRDIVVTAGAAFSEGNLISFLCSALYLRLPGNIIPKPMCTGVTPSLSYFTYVVNWLQSMAPMYSVRFFAWQISATRAWLWALVVVLARLRLAGGSCDGDTGADTPVSADTDHRPDTND